MGIMAKSKSTKANKKPKTKKKSRALLYIGIILALAGLAIIVVANQADDNGEEEAVTEDYSIVNRPVATIIMEGGDVIRVELDPAGAPNTVRNFIALASDGFYDGLIFHRVIPDFMIQGGCPRGDGTGGPGYSIRGEFSGNNFENPLSHTRGVISMARSNHPDSAGSQFFIMVADTPHLDGQYAAFGIVTEGMETVDRIVSVERNQSDKPLEEQVIESITVETFGVEYPPPDKL